MIIVYSTPTCAFCKLTKEYLASRHIEFKNIDVSEDMEAAREMVEKSGQTAVPVIQIRDAIIVGFDKPALDALLPHQ